MSSTMRNAYSDRNHQWTMDRPSGTMSTHPSLSIEDEEQSSMINDGGIRVYLRGQGNQSNSLSVDIHRAGELAKKKDLNYNKQNKMRESREEDLLHLESFDVDQNNSLLSEEVAQWQKPKSRQGVWYAETVFAQYNEKEDNMMDTYHKGMANHCLGKGRPSLGPKIDSNTAILLAKKRGIGLPVKLVRGPTRSESVRLSQKSISQSSSFA